MSRLNTLRKKSSSTGARARPHLPFEISMCDNACREQGGTIRAGNWEIQTPIAGLVFRSQTRSALAKDERPLPYLAFRNHAAADARCRGRALLRELPRTVPGHAC